MERIFDLFTLTYFLIVKQFLGKVLEKKVATTAMGKRVSEGSLSNSTFLSVYNCLLGRWSGLSRHSCGIAMCER